MKNVFFILQKKITDFLANPVVFMGLSFNPRAPWSHSFTEGEEYFLGNLFKLTAFTNWRKQ